MPQHAVARVDSVAGTVDRASHPRPQFVRDRWLSLDGWWDFAPGRDARERQRIRVPFAPEAEASGIGDTDFHPELWYRRTFEVPDAWHGERILLHFGAVDYRARVWVNGHRVAEHEGGHTPFCADVTDALGPSAQELVVEVQDDPFEMDKPRGKQDWRREPHGIWYPRTSGIWQSVWLEPVPATRLERVRFTPHLGAFGLGIDATVAGDPSGLELEVLLEHEGEVLVHDLWTLRGSTVTRWLPLPGGGVDDARRALTWSPETPTLLDVTLRLRRGDRALDQVLSYAALREVAVDGDRFLLNGRPRFLRLALDQGYWRDGLMTPPDDDALRRDVELAKRLGFDGVRKHQKLEDPRYLYWADRLGLMVWTELPSALTFSERGLERLTREWMEAIARDANHPSVVAWVAFNESWGTPDLPGSDRQRHAVRALHALARALDGTRPVVGNDGWEFVTGDLFTIHDYAADPATLERRYRTRESIARTVAEDRPGGHALRAEAAGAPPAAPVILSEFGGIRLDGGDGGGWGYSHAASPGELLERYAAMVRAVSHGALAGFCYTQLTDTFQEQNGLVDMERRPKADPDALARATRGVPE